MGQIIKIRRGVESNRNSIVPALGEILYTSDNLGVFFGDGATSGGNEIKYLSTITGGSVQGDISITGNLTVTGDITQTTSNNVLIGDSIIILNADSAETPVNNAGFEIERGLSDNVSILWNEGIDVWEINDGISSRRILDTSDIMTAGTGINITGSVISSTDAGSNQNIFKTFNADSGTLAASNNSDSFTFQGGLNTTTSISGKILTINSSNTTYTADETSLTLSGTEFQHKSGDGFYHLSDSGANSGKVLTATGTAGIFTWSDAGAAVNNGTITIQGDGLGLVSTAGDFNTNQGSDETIVISHSTSDGYLHVPVTGTSNSGKVLTAGATAGSFSWIQPQDQSDDVTLASVSGNYLSISGQEITAGIVPVGLGGTGATAPATARTNLGVDIAGTDNSTNVTLSGTPNYLTISGQTISLAKLDISDDTNMGSSDSSLLISGNNVTVNIVDGGVF